MGSILLTEQSGETVDAACMNTTADRQLTLSALTGANVLAVQRSISNGFRRDLVDTPACVGFNGTDFKALNCADNVLNPVSFQNGQLVRASGACQSGHDDVAQVAVGPSGQDCTHSTSTVVQPKTA